MKMKYGFINCVGLTDGTLLPLEFKPTKNGEDYYMQKGGYALDALVTCDEAIHIRDIVVGWPGCTHDNRVWSNCPLNRDSTKYFSEREYLLGDSAFQPSDIMVPAFRRENSTGSRPTLASSWRMLESRLSIALVS